MSFGFSVGDFIEAIKLAHKIRKEFADAPSQFKAISDDVRRLSIVLQDADSAFAKRELNEDQKRDLEDIDQGCRNILDELQQLLDKNTELSSETGSVGKRIRRVWKRLKWDPDHINELRSRISANINFLNAFNGQRTRDNVAMLVRHQENQERQTVLDWITPVDYAPQQHDYIARRQGGTGQWFLDSGEFQRWMSTEQQTLFCPGIPGSGKTILTSIVVAELTSRFGSNKNIGIAYIYCNFKQQDRQKAEDLLASLLKQLAQGHPSIPEGVKSLYDKHKGKGTRPSFEEISTTLQSVVALNSRVFIIIDALDECQISGGYQARFLKEIFDFQAIYRTNIFVTSRFIPEITERFYGTISREIHASPEDVQRYVDSHILDLPSFIKRNPDLQEEIKTEIVKAADGMFLLAHLHLKSLIGKISIKTVRTALKILPTGSEAAYDQAYEDVMKRIEGQITDQKKLAERVLSWITCAKRPLTTPELQYALAIETNASKLDEDNLSQVEDIVSVCAGLVTVDDESDIIRLVHYTAQQYFERTQKRWFPNAQSEITRICVTYLSFNAFDKGFCQTDEDFEDRLRSNPLYDYAAHNWGHHTRDDESPCQTVLDFLKCEKHVEASMQALMAVKKWSRHSEYSQNIPRNITGLHLASYFGLDKVVTQLISDGYGPDFKDSYDSTPLSWAAANGHKATVKLLLDTGKVEADSKDKNSQTPLLLAAKRGQVAIVKLLLDIDKVDGYSKNNKAFVKKLLATSKVNVNAKDRFNRTPLSHAAQNGYEAVVKLLLDTSKVDVDAKDRDGRTPLLYAAEKGREAVIKLLLDTGKVDVDAKNCDGCTPFTWASKNGHEAVVKLLNTTGKVNIDVENNWGRTPLSYAAESGHEVIVKLLLDNGADLESKDKLHGRTPLSYAAENGHEAVVKLLFSQGADVAAKDNSGGTALRLAAENGHKGIMKLLVEQGADNVVVA